MHLQDIKILICLCLKFLVAEVEVAAVPCTLGSLICPEAKMSVFFSSSSSEIQQCVCTQRITDQAGAGGELF